MGGGMGYNYLIWAWDESGQWTVNREGGFPSEIFI